ncbi:MAG: sulfatase-like hydrolase/transferase, partial [Alphaproteobacteria bacterium]|nr:sulfatase-like hydrolase/transferase [Alphaproteobacteria bacterium]
GGRAENQGASFIAQDNAWFDKLAADGYALRVYQSDYRNLCGQASIAYCFSYPTNGIAPIRDLDIPAAIKTRLIVGMFYKDTVSYRIANLADESFGGRLSAAVLPESWRGGAPGEPQLSPVATVPVIDRLIRDIRAHPRGTAFVAHLMLPHFSYQYDRECRLKPDFRTWLNRTRDLVTNDEASRRERYEAYLEQVRCATKQMDRVFAALKDAGAWDAATVILHGDHGSRISIATLGSPDVADFTDRDLVDLHSTFIAVKTAGRDGGHDGRQRSIRAIFAETVGLDADPDATPPGLLFASHSTQHKTPMIPVRMPELPDP